MTIGASPPSRRSNRSTNYSGSKSSRCSTWDYDAICDQVQMIKRYIRSINLNWPDHLAAQPAADPHAPDDDDKHAAAGDNNLD
ncbi:UNVERIFIED_CONTAM: hypothetical protein Sindi_0523800 [Sesamum indicum]